MWDAAERAALVFDVEVAGGVGGVGSWGSVIRGRHASWVADAGRVGLSECGGLALGDRFFGRPLCDLWEPHLDRCGTE